MIKRNVLLLILLVYICGCTTNSKVDYVKKIVGTNLQIDTVALVKGENGDSYWEELTKPVKIVVYSDSSNCSVCELKLPMWKIKYKEFEMKNRNIGLIFIINSDQIEDIELNIKFSKTPGIQLYDKYGWFKKSNFVAEERDLHVFLLDKNNEIILVGNPLENPQLTSLYKEAINLLLNT